MKTWRIQSALVIHNTPAMLTHINMLAMIASCAGYAEFEQFTGFDKMTSDTTIISSTLTSGLPATQSDLQKNYIINGTSNETIKTYINTTTTSKLETTTKNAKFKCPEVEGPINIGPYEVPTQRDLVSMVKDALLNSYATYNKQSMQLLKDIKEATKAAVRMQSKCIHNKEMYVKCLRIASKQCERYAKDSLTNLEAQRLDVLALTEDKICTLADMKADPLQLMKVLAQEMSILDFALPGFLILINNCNAHCIRSNTVSKRKPLRHMTDQDLVVRHILTKKNYVQLINDSKHKV